jgi:hypothetical protein
MSDFDDLVNQLIRMGYARETAEQEVRTQHPELSPTAPIASQNSEYVLEKTEQAEIYKLFRAYGFEVMNLSQARASKQAAGLGDAFVIHKTLPIAFWFECKRSVGGELSSEQKRFRDNCIRCNVAYHSGDRRHAAALLVFHKLAVPDPTGVHGIAPIRKGVQTVSTTAPKVRA